LVNTRPKPREGAIYTRRGDLGVAPPPSGGGG